MLHSKVCVIGAGQMGSGIAQVFLSSGREVCLVDSRPGATETAKRGMQKSLEKLVEKKVLSIVPSDTLARLQCSTSLEAARSFAPSLVVEAISENLGAKLQLFSDLSKRLSPSVVYASNTSSISITKLSQSILKPENMVGMHFMNPVPIMKLVEVIDGINTSKQVVDEVLQLAKELGKTTIRAKDYPGFLVNRVLMPMINEAFFALMEGVASAEDIDAGMKLGTNQPMGPLTLADFIGLDTCLSIMEVLFQGLGDSKYRPCPLLKQYVDAGWLGKKSSRGVYVYNQ